MINNEEPIRKNKEWSYAICLANKTIGQTNCHIELGSCI